MSKDDRYFLTPKGEQIDLWGGSPSDEPLKNKDGKTGEDLAVEGMTTALDHADAVSAEKEDDINAKIIWSNTAREGLDRYILKNGKDPFTAEDVRLWLEKVKFDLPPDDRAWGGIMRSTSTAELIKVVGIDRAKKPEAHMGWKTSWEFIGTQENLFNWIEEKYKQPQYD